MARPRFFCGIPDGLSFDHNGYGPGDCPGMSARAMPMQGRLRTKASLSTRDMSGSHVLGIAALVCTVLLATSAADAEIARDIEEKTEDLRASTAASDAATNEKVLALEAAIKRGEQASAGLWSQIKSLEAEKEALENEKRALEKIQVVLTSGLIGALVTAFVAILGTFLNFSRGRAERDLKRLEVLAKTVELESKGIPVPIDIQSNYTRQGST